MKKIAIVLSIMTAICLSCNSGKPEADSHTHPQDSVPESPIHSDHGKAALELNNGSKWNADSITNANVSRLISITDRAQPASLADYQNAGTSIQEGLNKLIQDCKMEGPDHEALHNWLMPVLDINKKLMESTSVEAAREIFEEEKSRINLYTQYFE